MKTILIITLSIFTLSCTTQRKCERKFPPRVETVTNTITIIRDSIVTFTLPGDTVRKTDTVWMDSKGVINSFPIENETEYCYSLAVVENGILRTVLRQKESEIQQLIEGAVKETIIEEKEASIVEVNRLYWWQKVLMYLGAVAVGSIVVYYIFGRK